MNKQIKWKFKSSDIYFVSSERNLTRDVMRNRERLKLRPTTKIEIINEFFTDDNSTTAGCTSCGNSSSNNVESTLSLGADEDQQSGQETTSVSAVHDVLDDLIADLDFMEGGDSSITPYSGDSFVDVDTDGQVD